MDALNPTQAFWSRSSLALALLCFLLPLGSANASAGVIYNYVQAGSGVVLGTLEVDSPPASGNTGWSTADDSALVALTLNDAVFGFGPRNLVVGNVVSFSATSLRGATLDAGGISLSLPTLPGDPTIARSLSLSFGLPLVADFAAAATTFAFSSGEVLVADQFVEGDWSVAEPSSVALVGLALLAIVSRNRRSACERTDRKAMRPGHCPAIFFSSVSSASPALRRRSL
jgi:hypothetical protein